MGRKQMGVKLLEVVQEEESSIEELKRTINYLKDKQKTQARIIIGWKNKYNNENGIVVKLKKTKDDHLKQFQSQLLIFESYLQKTRVEFENLVKHKDEIIKRQHQLICTVALALVKRGGQEDLKKILPGIKVDGLPSSPSSRTSTLERKHQYGTLTRKDSLIHSFKTDNESLNDSDSAIMMEDAYDSLIVLPTGKGEVKVMRSVSDALEIVARVSSSNNNKMASHNSSRRTTTHGSLSSTPSGSSEDESPPSTMNKIPCDLIKPEEILTRLRTTHPMNSPNIYSTAHTCKSPSCLSSYKSSNSFSSSSGSSMDNSSPPHLYDILSQRSVDGSDSSTPLASPDDSPRSSMINATRGTPSMIENSAVLRSSFSGDESDTTLSDGESNREAISPSMSIVNLTDQEIMARRLLFGSFEKLTDSDLLLVRKKPKDKMNQVTYNRVMSNHRSVTKPKDVKYKRINKAKSRSLEELRGKLKLWDINKQCITIELGQSDA